MILKRLTTCFLVALAAGGCLSHEVSKKESNPLSLKSVGPLVVKPELGLALDGWAGISMSLALRYSAWSADAKTFVLCNGDCALEDVATGKVEIMPLGEDFEYDGRPITEYPPFAERFRALGIPAPAGQWSYADDFVLTWSSVPDKDDPYLFSSLRFSLKDRATGEPIPFATFSAEGETEVRSIVPWSVSLSPDGRWLAVVVLYQDGQSLTLKKELFSVDALVAKIFPQAANAT
jgi:hypothetical protein